MRSQICKVKKNQVCSLKRTLSFKRSQIKGVKIEVKLEVLKNGCHITFALIAFAPKITLLPLLSSLNASSAEHGICQRETLDRNLVKNLLT